MSTVGKRLLSALVSEGSVQTYLKMSLSEDLFREGEVELFSAIHTHIASYGKIPSIETLQEKGLDDSLVETSEPPEYYMNEVEKRYLRTKLKQVVIKVNEQLVDENETEAYEIMMEDMMAISKKRHRNVLHDFREVAPMIMAEYAKQNKGTDDHALLFGWPRIDKMTGGMRGGDFITFVGRPASGKTFKLLYIAHKSWQAGRVPLFVSMEMNAIIINQRLAAMHTSQNLTNLIKGSMSTAKKKELLKGLTQAGTKDNPFWVVDGNLTATVDDIIMLCRQLGITDVYVDGAYLLRHPNVKMNKWDRQAENAEGLKQRVAQDLDIPVVASYQFSKTSKKDKKSKDDKVGMEDIYGSDAIAQLSTVILGLLEAEGIETQMRRKVSILKGRNGETGEFDINWDFNKMDFSQVLEKKDIDAMDEHMLPVAEEDQEMHFMG